MEIQQFVASALGDASYLVVSGSAAAVVDPQRDVRPYVEAAKRLGAEITHVFETHVHNDYVSGGPELAALGATIYAPRDAGIEFPHESVSDGDEVVIGGVHLRAMHAPGHTHHHTAYLAVDEAGQVAGAFTGGSLIIGGAGRTDLVDPESTESLTRMQWESVQRLREVLADAAEVLPTHGAGSFCSTQQGVDERRAPLRDERGRNFALTSEDYATFRAIQLANPGPVPAYYQYMAPINRRGATIYGTPPTPAAFTLETFEQARDAGSQVIDVRDRVTFAHGHVPGSLSVEEGGSALAFISWVTEFNAALLLVTEDEAQAARMTLDLFRIGYEQVRGFLPAAAWMEARTAATMQAVDRDEARGRFEQGDVVYDVRFDSDRRELTLPGALVRPIDRALEWVPEAEHEQPLVVCSTGLRSATVGSLLLAQGLDPVVLINGGTHDLVDLARQAER